MTPSGARAARAAGDRWRQVHPATFIEETREHDGSPPMGHGDPRCWSPAGWRWREANAVVAPRFLRRVDGQWRQRVFGQWQALPLAAPAVHLAWFEADACCRRAGCRLPSEAEWEAIAIEAGAVELAAGDERRFHWGAVGEWTASRFVPYAGFRAHPYRGYSAPWSASRFVLRGARHATAPEMAHPRYRNFFTPERDEIFSGCRSCAVGG
ncbi:MAG: SUMF1/EgtB/PvdO family nonheme iron enzyme [Candidatus Accumulibacter sp.]|nr:SUMF1/EgtB/PvdO family nonheme iron enzyme [Accumulibacter sp.]